MGLRLSSSRFERGRWRPGRRFGIEGRAVGSTPEVGFRSARRGVHIVVIVISEEPTLYSDRSGMMHSARSRRSYRPKVELLRCPVSRRRRRDVLVAFRSSRKEGSKVPIKFGELLITMSQFVLQPSYVVRMSPFHICLSQP